ncbi:MAG: RNA polymerase sigma factor [Gammaproteobacteria bacterium]
MILRLQQRSQLEALRPRMYRLAWSWCHDADLADELTQAAYARAIPRLGSLREEERLEAWMCTILSNLFRDHLRARKPQAGEEALDALQDPGLSPDGDMEEHQLVIKVRAAIAQLPYDQRMVVTLVDLMELSYAEVAKTLDIPAGTVMSRLNRARGRLREMLADKDSARGEGGSSPKVVNIRSRR